MRDTIKPIWRKNTYCSFCGHHFDKDQPWPRQCSHCQQLTYLNPIPVAVLLLPVGNGILTIRRNIEPRKGQLALPGGFIDGTESWQSAAARELYEEAQIQIEPDQISLFQVHSAPDGTLLIFGLAPHYPEATLPAFHPSAEISDRVIIYGTHTLAFPLHTQVTKAFFDQC
ncbi:MAG: NUDIX domain-containing protein [Chloroflexota bacterium]